MKKKNIITENIELVRAKSLQECKKAILCCISSFYPKGFKKKDIKIWKHKWFSDPQFKFKNLILAKKGDKIVGGLRTSSFKIKRLEETYKCLGISEIFIKSEFRDLKISNRLIDFSIRIAEEKKYDLLVACASRKVNGFYLKKNFYGIGSYPQLEFSEINELKKIRGYSQKKVNFNFKPCKFLPEFEKFYNVSYKNVFGRILREKKKWKFIIKSLENYNFSILGIYEKKNFVGYLIHNQFRIYEISFKKNINVKNLLFDLSNFLKSNNLVFFISPKHSLLSKDYGFDVSVKLRNCFYGGHVARITNINSIRNKFFLREKKRLKKKINKPFSFEITKVLLGIASQTPSIKKVQNKFSEEPFIFSKVDEFF
tara:strand:- start:1112 stop:2218 length:1107 start_codon:yes stop_codon:yes gene_type:complete